MSENSQGFGLMELMMALVILTFGLLATGQLLYATAGLGCLSRSKSAAAAAAQNTLERLSALYRGDPSAVELASGAHGPMQIEITNPLDGRVLNRYRITWTAGDVSDPRPGQILKARAVSVCVTPMQSETTKSTRSMLGKTLTVATIFSAEAR